MYARPRSPAAVATAAAILLCIAPVAAGEPPLTAPVDVPSWDGDRPIERGEPRPHQQDGGDSHGDGVVTDPVGPRPREPVFIDVADLPEINPVSAACTITDRTFPNGAPAIEIENTGSVTIPAGSKITVTYSDGTTRVFVVSKDIVPGAKAGISGHAGLLADAGASCAATVEIAEPEIRGDAIP